MRELLKKPCPYCKGCGYVEIQKRPPRKYGKRYVLLVKALRKRGFSLRKIGKIMNLHFQTVSNLLKRK